MNEFLSAIRKFLSSPRRNPENEYQLLSGDRDSPSLSSRGRILRNGTTHHRTTSSSISSPWRTKLSRSPRFIFHVCFPCTLRRILVSLSLIPLLLVIGILSNGIPPSYDDIREYERRLPQHNLSLAPPEGNEGAYLRFPGHLWGHGLNNILQETYVLSFSLASDD